MDITGVFEMLENLPKIHNSLAKHYEDAAKEMQSKVEEHKKMLELYESNIPHYGIQAPALISHCKSLICSYEQAVKANIGMANSHWTIAREKLNIK